MKRRWIFIFLLILVVSTFLWWVRSGSQMAPSSMTESAEPALVSVMRGDLAAFVEPTGRVEAQRRAHLSLPIGGIVSELYVEVGDTVKADAALLAIDPSELLLRQEEAQAAFAMAEARFVREINGRSPAEIEAAQAKLTAAQLGLSVAEVKLDQLPEDERAESQEAVAVEQARAQLSQARAAFRRLVDGPSAEEREVLVAEVEQANIQLKQAEAALANATLQAPFTGTITARQITVGERANPSQMLLSIADLNTLFIAAEVDEVDVARVDVGQVVTVTLDAFPTRPFAGKVARIDPASDSQRGATTYRTTIHFDSTALPIRLDMAADVRIRTADAENVLLLPLNAIRYAETQPYVLVRQGNDSVEKDVVLGAQDDRMVEILQGVAEGEIVEVP